MAEAQNQAAGQFAIQKIYVKDVSFETPNSPAIFTETKWEPEVNVQLNSRAAAMVDQMHEVVLSVTITAKLGDKTAYLVEVQQAGIFRTEGFEQQQLSHLLGSFCPSILFPYVREAISDLVTRGGFPQLLLAPVNFDALYAQHMQQTAGKEVATH
jgi:preprotein translocase subunit SecB